MKIRYPIAALLFTGCLAWACDKKEQDNVTLYNEVMGIHDEVMPKMDDIYKLKETLKNKIAADSAMAEDKKEEIESAILELDDAAEGMMAWMRRFTPLPDSTGTEAARDYLEGEKVSVEKVKSDILTAIEKGTALSQQ